MADAHRIALAPELQIEGQSADDALTALLAALHCAYPDAALTSALAADAPAATARDDWYGQRVDAAFVAGYAVLPKPEDVTIIDSRPAARKYDRGHIPTAINIPDTQFDKQSARLPANKTDLLIFYCGGLDCMLSHASAFKAEKLGYTQIKVYPAGMPEWKARFTLRTIRCRWRLWLCWPSRW